MAWWKLWKAKIGFAILLGVVIYVGFLHYRLSETKGDLRAAEITLEVAKDANASNARTIATLGAANEAMAAAARLSDEALEKLNEDAKRAKQAAARARSELARLRELDRGAPDCAALLDRSLSVCPSLVDRLWPAPDQN